MRGACRFPAVLRVPEGGVEKPVAAQALLRECHCCIPLPEPCPAGFREAFGGRGDQISRSPYGTDGFADNRGFAASCVWPAVLL